jgi:DNA-binding SARP family transcriptional activator
MFVLRALGAAEIDTGKTTINPSQSVLFAAALYLIVERPNRVSRQRLSSLLWPDIPATLQGHRLRQTVYQLKSIGMRIDADRNHLVLAADAAITDFDHNFRDEIGQSKRPRSVDFLPGYAPDLSVAFSHWLDQVRDRVHAELTRLIVADLADARSRGAWGDVERLSSACLELDAYNEAAILARAEAFAMRGQKAAAIAVLDNYSQDLGPGAQTLELPANILRRRVLQYADCRQAQTGVDKEPDFVGRTPEMAALMSMLEAARKARGSGCLVEGEAGIGKTRLSSELAAFAALQGFRVERVACKRADADQPLSAFVTLVPRLRELPGALGCSRSTITWLKRLTEFDALSSESALSGEDSTTLYTHVRSAVFDLLDAVSEERSLLIIVEDVQWLDRASASLFGAILDWIPTKKMLLLFNTRESANPLTNVVSREQLSVVRLAPLENTDALRLIRTLIVGSPIEHADLDIDWLIKTGDGNPYFLQELAKYWIESGRKRDVPPSIAAVLDERLRRLSPPAYQLLQACAVLGEHCTLERLEQVFDYPPQDLFAGVQELSGVGMVRPTQPEEKDAARLLVRHDLLAIEVLQTLAPTSRAFLHRRCGIVLEREVLGPSISIALMRACAFHWYRSGSSERAYSLAIKCANHLLEIGLAAEATAAFEGALGFCSTPKAQAEVLRRIIESNRLAGDKTALVAGIKRLRLLEEFATANAHHDDLEVLEFETLRTTELRLCPVLGRTRACVFDASLPPAHRVKVAVAAVKIATSLADLDEIERVYGAVAALLSDSTVEVSARLQIQVIYHTMCGDLNKALLYARERVAVERTRGLTVPLANAMTDLGFVLRRTGPREEQLSVMREGYETAMLHNHYFEARDCAQKIASMLEDDELPGSAEWTQRAVENGQFTRDVHGSFSYNADCTRTALRENRLDDARKLLRDGFDWEWLTERRMWLAVAVGLRIRLLIAEKASVSETIPEVHRLSNLYETIARLGRQDYEIAALVQGFVYVGDLTQAKRYLEDFLQHTRRDFTPLVPELKALALQFGMAIGQEALVSTADRFGRPVTATELITSGTPCG